MASEVSKKVLWVFVFLILAAIAVLGVLFIRGYQTGRQVTSIEQTPQPQASSETGELSVTIDNPSQDVATSSAKIAVSGKTIPEAIVSISGGVDDVILTAQDDGSYRSTVSLTEGVNTLIVDAFTEDGDSAQAQTHIVYTKGAL